MMLIRLCWDPPL